MVPCSVHDVEAAYDYAKKLVKLREKFAGELEIVMRVYFEKPRTSIGWKGLINDPHLDGSYDINEGLRLARKLLLDLAELGLPAGTELLESNYAPIHCRCDYLDCHWCSHDRKPNPSGNGFRAVYADWL